MHELGQSSRVAGAPLGAPPDRPTILGIDGVEVAKATAGASDDGLATKSTVGAAVALMSPITRGTRTLASAMDVSSRRATATTERRLVRKFTGRRFSDATDWIGGRVPTHPTPS
jgi:hypothetical protein